MTKAEMKQVLFEKLQDEGCSFKKNDIKVEKKGKGFWITVSDYEHIPFLVFTEQDDYFGNVVWVYRYYKDFETGKLEKDSCIDMFDSKKEYRLKDALVYLGYHIGTRF